MTLKKTRRCVHSFLHLVWDCTHEKKRQGAVLGPFAFKKWHSNKVCHTSVACSSDASYSMPCSLQILGSKRRKTTSWLSEIAWSSKADSQISWYHLPPL